MDSGPHQTFKIELFLEVAQRLNEAYKRSKESKNQSYVTFKLKLS